jgi:hypothetical protein
VPTSSPTFITCVYKINSIYAEAYSMCWDMLPNACIESVLSEDIIEPGSPAGQPAALTTRSNPRNSHYHNWVCVGRCWVLNLTTAHVVPAHRHHHHHHHLHRHLSTCILWPVNTMGTIVFGWLFFSNVYLRTTACPQWVCHWAYSYWSAQTHSGLRLWVRMNLENPKTFPFD